MIFRDNRLDKIEIEERKAFPLAQCLLVSSIPMYHMLWYDIDFSPAGLNLYVSKRKFFTAPTVVDTTNTSPQNHNLDHHDVRQQYSYLFVIAILCLRLHLSQYSIRALQRQQPFFTKISIRFGKPSVEHNRIHNSIVLLIFAAIKFHHGRSFTAVGE